MATTLLNNSNICRLCSAEFDDGFGLFEPLDSFQPLEIIINKYLPLKVTDDGKLPRCICQPCNGQVREITTYFDVLIAGQRRLRELFKEQTERLRKEERLFEGQTFAGGTDGGPLYDGNHPASLAFEGREAPRRRPGRPRKPKPVEISVDVIVEDPKALMADEEAVTEDVVDPEQALELMFKEAEEKRLESGDQLRTRRRRKVPTRFSGVVQGKELDAILKDEGVIDPEEEEEEEEEAALSEEDGVGDLQLDVEPEDEADLEHNGDELETIAEDDEEHSTDHTGRRNAVSKTKSKGKVGRPKKRRFMCQFCSKSFLHSGHYSYHIRTRHQSSRVTCATCKLPFPTKEELQAHQIEEQHTEAEPTANPSQIDASPDVSQISEFKCFSCEQIFSQQPALTNHIVQQHASENSNICELCGKVFQHPSSVGYHKEVAHNKTAYKCEICGKGFKHRQLLQRHSMVHTDERPFVCHICGATFKTRANLYNHNNIHTVDKPYQCEYCDAKFNHKTSLVLHTRWHTGEKPYHCTVCPKRFSQSGNLMEHMRIHTGEKPYACEVCSKRFTTSSQQRLHMKRHTGERPWKCEYCGKDFLHKDSWKCHLRRHRGEKPFSCPVCPRAFTEQWALKKHVRLHTGEKPYSCNVCSKTFADLSNLQKHKKTHKNQQAMTSDTVALTQDEANDGLSITDGQHIIYVSSDQSQVLISTIASEQNALSDGNNMESLILDDGAITIQGEAEDNVREAGEEVDENLLTIVGVDGADQVDGQTVEFTTQDGNRVRLLIPADVDPYQFTADYLSSLSG